MDPGTSEIEDKNMKIIGILLIFNALFLSIWWLCTAHPYKVWASFAGLVAIFVGVYFTLQDRAIEIKFEKIGTIKAAAEQATIDAQAVSDLRKRIEAQSATVDIVAQSATKAHDLIKDLSRKNRTAEAEISKLEIAGSTIQKTVAELHETAEFMSLVAAAQNDDRTAFNKLIAWINNKASAYWQNAADAVVRIRTDFSGPIKRGHMNMSWPKSVDPTQLSLAQLRQTYRIANRVYKADLVKTVWNSNVIDKKEKMDFFVDILREDDSLGATFFAGKYFVEASSDPDLKWSPFFTKPLLDWWAENHNRISQSD